MSNLTIEVKNDSMLGRLNENNLHIELIKKDKEIKRLNNIIDELENYIKQSNITDNDNYGYPTEFKIIYVDSLLEKLRELKEGK